MSIRNFIYNNPLSAAYSGLICTLVVLTSFAAPALAAGSEDDSDDIIIASPADRYTSTSALASGNWAKVKVEQTGMQFISAATLRQLGFSNPAKVNVYGFGGRILPETLSPMDPDDLPVLPVVRSDAGIWFFGYDHIRWNYSSGQSGNLTFSHQMQPYAEESWYFISDCESEGYNLPLRKSEDVSNLPIIDSFSQMLLHEKELYCPATTGRVIVGEDFRSPSTRSFPFALTDLADDYARIKISFASSTSGASSITVKANGKQLNASTGDRFAAITNSDQYYYLNSSIKEISNPSENLSVEISFQNSGTISLARLDYIEVEYPRELILRNGTLHFNIDAEETSAVRLDGVTPSTIVWDITDPVRPVEVELSVAGSQGVFVSEKGVREYVAFTPGSRGIAISSGVKVSNQNLHALPTPQLLIISPAEYKSAADRLAAHHRDFDKMDVAVLTPEEIYNEFSSATPDPSAFRRIMKMWHDREPGKLRYCVIMSRPTYDHKSLMSTTKAAKYPRIPIWHSTSGYSKNTSYSTDDFIGMLEDCPSSFNISTATLQVSVGRMPVTSLTEANQMVDKYISYATSPEKGDWRNHIMIIADDQDGAIHFTQAQDSYKEYTSTPTGNRYLFERLYLDTYTLESGATGQTYPEAKKRMLQLWNKDGVSMINYIGHASPVGWGHEDLLNWNDIMSFSNSKLPFLYAATCEFARYDDDTRSGAEVLWAYPNAGLIGMVCPSRTVFMSPNGTLSKAFAKAFFNTPSGEKPGRRIGDIYREAKNSIRGSDDNKLRFPIIGNPAMSFPTPSKTIKVENIANLPEAQDVVDFPVLTARSKVAVDGAVYNFDGTLADDFNGTLDIMLYDAESVIETLGNGENGVKQSYNDRRTLLYRGVTKVTAGKWATELFIPSEIQNNYAPARIVLYASADSAPGSDPTLAEAHGESSRFYVYGYNQDIAEDEEGPEITMFAINRADFSNGGVVGASPVVLAKMSDPSGINLSDAGIGHKLTLLLDGKKYYDDANSYYTPEIDDPTSGSLTYPLSELSAGQHTLKLSVWDNLGNSSSATLEFEVAANLPPHIYDLSTDVNPARENVNFTLSTDSPMTRVDALIEVFDLNGRRVWQSSSNKATDMTAGLKVGWDLTDANGNRVPRGIYLYRATITSDSGSYATKTEKLAVTAP